MTKRHVKLFMNGRNQAVRIPREFELPGEDAITRKEGQRLIIEPAPPESRRRKLSKSDVVRQRLTGAEGLAGDSRHCSMPLPTSSARSICCRAI
jgi:virulence-associated protein VagC